MKVRSAAVIFIIGFFAVQTQSIFGQVNCTGKQTFSAKSCAGDEFSTDETALFQIMKKYRASNGRPEIRISQALSVVANRHVLDLKQNMKTLTHS